MVHITARVRNSHRWERGESECGQYEDDCTHWERWDETCSECGAVMVLQLEKESNLSRVVSTDPDPLDFCDEGTGP